MSPKQASTSRGRGVPRSGEARAKGAHMAPLLWLLAADHREFSGSPQAAKELRALLNVVAKAKRAVAAVKAMSDGSWEWTDCPPGDPDGDLARALSRLARAARRSP